MRNASKYNASYYARHREAILAKRAALRSVPLADAKLSEPSTIRSMLTEILDLDFAPLSRADLNVLLKVSLKNALLSRLHSDEQAAFHSIYVRLKGAPR